MNGLINFEMIYSNIPFHLGSGIWLGHSVLETHFLVSFCFYRFVGLSNVALNKTATQSSNYYHFDEVFFAHLAVDGDPYPYLLSSNPTCSHTAIVYGIVNAWWQVDLAKQYRIEAITIQNRGDCCGMSYFI